MKKNWFSLISLIIIFALCLNLLLGNTISGFINNEETTADGIDFSELYPFDEEVDIIGAPIYQKKRTIYDKVADRMIKYSKIGETRADTIIGYQDIALAGFLTNAILTDSRIGTGYFKLNNGYWARTAGSEVAASSYQKIANQYNTLERYAEDKGMGFLYVQTPITVENDQEQIPAGISYYGNANVDGYLLAMANNDMNYLDLRDNFQEDAIDHYSFFYKTDHHWTIEAGLYAASEIVSKLNEQFGTQMIRADQMGAYLQKTYEGAMFGSAGQGVTHYLENSEDFTILYPDFENSFHLLVPDKNVDVTGSFEELFYDYQAIEDIQNAGGGYVYETVLYGNRPLITIENLNNSDGPHIVMIRDSYGIAVAPFLALSCSRLDLIDARASNGNFNGSIINYLNTEEPDLVIILEKSPYEIKLNK